MEEIWKDIPDYDGMYQASNLGRIKSLKYGKERIIKNYFDGKGYFQTSLSKKSKQKTIKVHKIIALVFLNHKPCGHNMYIDHINNIKTDNSIENLQIITSRENNNKDRKNESSKYRGVSWSKTAKKWVSKIEINRKTINLGYFDNEEEAGKYYINALKSFNNNEEIVIKKGTKTSQYKGVCWYKRDNKWMSFIKINKKHIYIGLFKTELEAHEAYENKLKTLTL